MSKNREITTYILIFIFLCAPMMAVATVAGCQQITTAPTTQPTAQGVLTVTAAWQAYNAMVQGEILGLQTGAMSKAQGQSLQKFNKQAYADILAAQNAALSGSSGAQGLSAVATASLQAAQKASTNSTPATQP